jgi:hypothetical protein
MNARSLARPTIHGCGPGMALKGPGCVKTGDLVICRRGVRGTGVKQLQCRIDQIEASIARYLSAMEAADRQESETAPAKSLPL